MGIAQNQVSLYFRRVHRDRLCFDEGLLMQLADAFEGVASDENQTLGYLRGCLGQLEGRARELCELRYVRDLKPAAIAQSVGMTANSVAKALQRIREQLRACVERKSAVEGGL
jgi:RNA polymerase sigma-70 factor (ECF subfamily)